MNNDVVKRNKKEKSGVIGGLLLILIATILLFWNESRAVDTEKVIGLAKDSYVEVSSSAIDESNEGKLVVTSGQINLVNDMVYDEEFNVGIKTAKLNRVVEMLQWTESCTDTDNGKETCTYKKEWKTSIIDDSNFESGYVNPDEMPYKNQTFIMTNIKLGEYILTNELLNQLTTRVAYTQLSESVANSKKLNIVDGKYTTYKSDETPQIGDIRISFVYNDATDISIIGVQKGDTFASFSPENTTYTILELKEKIMSGSQFIDELNKNNTLTTWVLRLVGTILMIAAIALILTFIKYLASFIPLLGKIAINALGLVSLLVGLSLSLLVIAISWFAVRPLLSIILIIAIIGLIILIKKVNKSKENTETKTKNN